VVTCFHAYIKPALLQITGDQPQAEHDAILVTPYRKKSGLTHFVKARVQGGKATILDKQLSYQMDTYAQANAFVVLNEEQEDFKIGEKVRIIFFYNYKDIKL
jgi:molybdopterin molybdotransferase